MKIRRRAIVLIEHAAMTTKERNLLTYRKAESEAEELLIAAGIYFVRPTIWEVLVEYFERYDAPTDVLYEGLDAERIFSVVSEYYDRNGWPLAVVNISFPEYAEEIANGKIEKAQVKMNGTVWVVHKSDKDTFPSDPHAHDYENNVKLDLGTGIIYRGRNPYKKISKKELITLRGEINSRLPELILPVIGC